MKKQLLSALAVIVAMPLIMGNEGGCTVTRDITNKEQLETAANQERLNYSTPLPQLDNSLERENLIERAKTLNARNATGCVTLILPNGTIAAQSVVKRKVSSLNSYLTGKERIVNDPYGSMEAGGQLVESPDIDGSYGENVQGIFWFNAETGAYEEWNGLYFFSNKCAKLSTPPLIVTSSAR